MDGRRKLSLKHEQHLRSRPSAAGQGRGGAELGAKLQGEEVQSSGAEGLAAGVLISPTSRISVVRGAQVPWAGFRTQCFAPGQLPQRDGAVCV